MAPGRRHDPASCTPPAEREELGVGRRVGLRLAPVVGRRHHRPSTSTRLRPGPRPRPPPVGLRRGRRPWRVVVDRGGASCGVCIAVGVEGGGVRPDRGRAESAPGRRTSPHGSAVGQGQERCRAELGPNPAAQPCVGAELRADVRPLGERPGRARRATERRERDSNPRRVAPHTLSKRADSAALAPLLRGLAEYMADAPAPKVAAGSCAIATREPSQGRKAAALSGACDVPQIAWPSPWERAPIASPSLEELW